VRQLLARNPEALVLTGGHHSNETRALVRGRGLPVIEMWDLPAEPLGHVVGFSNRDAAAALADRLIERGYRRFVLLGETHDRNTRGSERRAGFVRSLQGAGLDDDRRVDFCPPPISMQQGARALPEILQRWPDTEVVLCVSDPCAFGVQTEAQRMGLAVPADLAVAGFGDFEVSRLAVPSITTVAIDALAIGRLAGELIIEIRDAKLRGARLEPQKVLVPASPVLRGSTERRRRRAQRRQTQ